MKVTPFKKMIDAYESNKAKIFCGEDELKQKLVNIRIKQEELSREAMAIEEELLNRFSERYVKTLQEAIINFVNS